MRSSDPAVDGKIDLGEVLTEQLALSLEPYPRAPGASFAAINPGDEGEPPPATGPFAALAKLKKGQRKAAPRRAESKSGCQNRSSSLRRKGKIRPLRASRRARLRQGRSADRPPRACRPGSIFVMNTPIGLDRPKRSAMGLLAG